MFLPEHSVLDFQDDKGALLREVFPKHALIPESVKVAMPTERLRQVGDEHFALVFENEGECYRKFACVDEGHTVVSAIYLTKTAHKLPVEAQKVAAQNVVTALQRYDLPCPNVLLKLAAGEVYLAGDTRGVFEVPTSKLAGLPGMLLGGAKSLASKAMANPMGALGTVGTAMSVAGTASEIKNNVKNLSPMVGQ